MKKIKLKDYLPIIVMLCFALAFGLLLFFGIIDINAVPEIAKSKPFIAFGLIFLLFVLKGLSGVIIYNALIIVVSLVYPLPLALTINAVGTAVTLSVSYFIGYYTKTESLEQKIERHPKLAKYFNGTKKNGFLFCFVVHTLGLSMEVLGVIFGMMKIGYLKYLISSWLAIIPGMICFTVVGHDLDFRSPFFWIVLAVDLLMILFGFLYSKKHYSNS